VGIDASSASADPARAPWRSTASSCQVPGTPRSSTLPRSANPVPEPTISRTQGLGAADGLRRPAERGQVAIAGAFDQRAAEPLREVGGDLSTAVLPAHRWCVIWSCLVSG